MDWKEIRKILEGEPSAAEVERIVMEVRAHYKSIRDSTRDYTYLRDEDCREVIRKLVQLIYEY